MVIEQLPMIHKKRNLTLKEHEDLCMDLDFIVSTLNVAFNHDPEEFSISPLIFLALMKAQGAKELIESVDPCPCERHNGGV